MRKDCCLTISVYTNSVYTPTVHAEFAGFDWDVANVGHILRHGVTPEEVEQTIHLAHLTFPSRSVGGEERWQLFGRTAVRRFLVVVFTIRNGLFRTVTAYPMNAAQRKKYAPQIDKDSRLSH